MAILREIFVYSIFLLFLFLVSFTNKDLNSFMYQRQIQTMFGIRETKSSLDKIVNVEDLWDWSRNYFAPAFNRNYKNMDPVLKNYMIDQTSYIIGKPVIRQIRIKNGKKIKIKKT